MDRNPWKTLLHILKLPSNKHILAVSIFNFTSTTTAQVNNRQKEAAADAHPVPQGNNKNNYIYTVHIHVILIGFLCKQLQPLTSSGPVPSMKKFSGSDPHDSDDKSEISPFTAVRAAKAATSSDFSVISAQLSPSGSKLWWLTDKKHIHHISWPEDVFSPAANFPPDVLLGGPRLRLFPW